MRPLVRTLNRPKVDGDLHATTIADVLPVIALNRDDTISALRISETTDGTMTVPPSSSSDAVSGPQPLPRWPVSSTVGRAPALSVLSDSLNFAVDPKDAPESVTAEAYG